MADADINEELLRAAKAVAFSNGFDAALPDKMAALRDVIARVRADGVRPPEFQEVSYGVDAAMRPVKGMAISDYAFRQWAKDVGIVLANGVTPHREGQQ